RCVTSGSGLNRRRGCLFRSVSSNVGGYFSLVLPLFDCHDLIGRGHGGIRRDREMFGRFGGDESKGGERAAGEYQKRQAEAAYQCQKFCHDALLLFPFEWECR